MAMAGAAGDGAAMAMPLLAQAFPWRCQGHRGGPGAGALVSVPSSLDHRVAQRAFFGRLRHLPQQQARDHAVDAWPARLPR